MGRLPQLCENERILFLGLSLASNLLQAPLPELVRGQIHGSAQVKGLVMEDCQRLFATTNVPPSGLERGRLHFQVQERWRDSPWTCLHLAMTPMLNHPARFSCKGK
jgi:hypothetical protein